MKKFVSTVIIAGLCSLGIAQESTEGISTLELEDVTVSPANISYLNTTKNKNNPEIARELQQKAAAFDVTEMPGYSPKATLPIEVLFRASNGRLLAAYDTKGKILFTNENFENVVLPMAVREMVFSENDGWQMKDNQYLCVYTDNQVVKRRYKINLTDGDATKKLVINLED